MEPNQYIRPKHWRQFQHYKQRNPPWIKLNRSLLDDYDFQMLSDASRALAPMLWLLASEHSDGLIEFDVGKIAFRLRMVQDKFEEAVKELIAFEFFEFYPDAIETLAPCNADATPETETETETEGEGEGVADATVAASDDASDPFEIPPALDRRNGSNGASRAPPVPVQKAFENYNVAADELGLPQAQTLSDDRRRKLAARLREHGIEGWNRALIELEESDFCQGKNDRGWRADLDFLLQPKSFNRLLEGAYRTEAVA